MSQLTDNLSAIVAIKSNIKDAIESKGVDMTGVSFGSYADKIGEIQTGGQFVTEPLSVSINGTYTPGQGVDGFSQVTVNVPQGVTGYTLSDITATKYLSESVISDSTVSLIDHGKFGGLRRVYFAGGTVQNTHIPGINTTHYYFPNCSQIFDYAFDNNSMIEYISLPICEYIGPFAFQACSKLSYIELPSCSYIFERTFMSCKSLSYASLPVCVAIWPGAFSGCTLLSSVLMKCRSISASAFRGCSNLTTVMMTGTTVCKLFNTNAFSGTPISGTGSGSIFVLSSLVDAYKSAANWSQYSSHIFPIPE